MRRANLYLQDVKIGSKNFEGREGDYNVAGKRNFLLYLEPEMAEVLSSQGWNIKWPKNEDYNPYLKVNVNFNYGALKVILITNGQPKQLTAETAKLLDSADLETVDICINPYEYQPGKISASLVSIYATVKTDEFLEKYGY